MKVHRDSMLKDKLEQTVQFQSEMKKSYQEEINNENISFAKGIHL